MNSGGVESQVFTITSFLNNGDFNVYIASAGGNLADLATEDKLATHFKLPLDKKNPFFFFYNVYKLAALIKKFKIDIVHSHSRLSGWCAFLACKITKCKFITTIHGAHSVGSFLKNWYNSIVTKGDRVIVVSKFIEEYAKKNYKFDHNKIQLIYCGIDTDKFNFSKVNGNKMAELISNLRIPTDKPIITLPARFSKNKGHETLIEAVKLLKKNSVTCLFVGDYSKNLTYFEQLMHKIKDYQLTENIVFTGNISDMATIYAISDIVLSLSTKPEAFGLTSIEAQALGKKIIATKLGGIIETMIENETGWLIEPNNPEELADKINFLLSFDKSLNTKISREAIINVNKYFSLALMEKKTISL